MSIVNRVVDAIVTLITAPSARSPRCSDGAAEAVEAVGGGAEGRGRPGPYIEAKAGSCSCSRKKAVIAPA